MKANVVTVAGLLASLALGAFCFVGIAGTAQAAPIGGLMCVEGHVYHHATTYQIEDCHCPPGSQRHDNHSNGDYWCTYAEIHVVGPARKNRTGQLPNSHEVGTATPK